MSRLLDAIADLPAIPFALTVLATSFTFVVFVAIGEFIVISHLTERF